MFEAGTPFQKSGKDLIFRSGSEAPIFYEMKHLPPAGFGGT